MRWPVQISNAFCCGVATVFLAASAMQHLRFRFNEMCWSGRPFLAAIEVTLGVPALRALLDSQLGKVDLAEISEDSARRAKQSNVKLWASSPLTLYAVKFAAPAKSANDRTLREALNLSLDRNAMAQVLLQKQAEAAPSFLPQWLSGYAFLFDMDSNLERAKELRAGLAPSSLGAAQPLRLLPDGNSELSKLIAERVVVNARAAGLTLQIVSRSAMRPAPSDSDASKVESGTLPCRHGKRWKILRRLRIGKFLTVRCRWMPMRAMLGKSA